MRKDTESVSQIYAASLSANGITPTGFLWPKAHDLATRFEGARST
jgi:hypothetical protein